MPVRTPLENAIRKTKLFSAVILLGMFYGYFYALLPPAFLLWLIAPIALIIMLVIWALPDRDRAPPVGAVEGLFFAFAIAWAIWPDYLAVKLPGLPWITTIRLFAAPMTLLLLVCISTSADFRSTIKQALAQSPWITRLLVTVVVLQVLTVPFSDTPFGTLNKVMDAQFEWTALFFAGVLIFQRPGRAMQWAFLMCCAVVVVCVIAELEYKRGAVLWAGNVPSFLVIEDESVQRAMSSQARSAVGQHRVRSVFGLSLTMAEFLGLMTPFILHFLFTARAFLFRVVNLLMIPVIFHVILVSQSRLGFVGFFLSCLLYLLLWSYRRWRRHRTDLVAPTVVFAYPAIFAGFILSTFFVGRIRNMVWGTGAQSASNQSRADMFDMAMPMIAKWPIGHGLGRGAATLGFTNPAGMITIDSYFLSVALELGVIGFIAYFGMFAVGGVQAFRKSAVASGSELSLLTPLAIALPIFIVVKSVLSADEGHALVFMMLAMVVALTYRVNTEKAHG